MARIAPRFAFAAALAVGAVGFSTASFGDDPRAPGAVLPRPAGRSFPTREEAAKALFAAMEKNDDAALREILGAGGDDLAQDGNDDAVRKQRALLAQTAQKKLGFEEQAGGRAVILVGEMDYPLAIPLVKDGDAWRFDAAAGRRELLARRIGEHELEAIGICLTYADAQAAYASADRDGDGVAEYAQRLSSTPGKTDGLYWPAAQGAEPSPAGTELAPLRDALADAGAGKTPPFDGYYWRILKAQGPNAPGGAHSYVINDNMVAGFALLAVPAVHRNTGVKSFLVSHHGKVYEKDLGPDGLRTAAGIEAFDPASTWREVDAATLEKARGSSPDDAPFAGARPIDAVPTVATEPAGFLPPPTRIAPGPDVRPPAPPPCRPR